MQKTIQLFSLFSGMVLLSGVALAGSLTDIDQVGSSNSANVGQSGDGNTLLAVQGSTHVQSLTAKISGTDNKEMISQTSNGGNNTVTALTVTGMRNKANISQIAKTTNIATIIQNGNDNQLVGANSDGTLNPGANAFQQSVKGNNLMEVSQGGNGNKVGLHQYTWFGNNIAKVEQTGGGNEAVAYQVSSASTGVNSFTSYQNGGDTFRVDQTAANGNTAFIDQR